MKNQQSSHFVGDIPPRMSSARRVEAEAFAASAVTPLTPVLPRWGLHNTEYFETEVCVGETAYIVELSPWRGNGREFSVTPKGRRRTPFVRGFVDVNVSGLWFQPEHFIPDRSRRLSR